ncbi:MAG: hypothetical protein ABJN40_22285 [Sneathiella sp.]
MGYFEGLTDTVFKRKSAGETIFYPWGVLGSGVILETEEDLSRIRGVTLIITMTSFFIVMVIHFLAGLWLNAIFLTAFCIFYHFLIKRMTRNFPKTEERLRLTEALQNSAKSHNLVILIFFEICSLVFFAGGFFILFKGDKILLALSGIGFCGIGSIIFGYMIYTKIKQKRDTL